MRAELLNEQIVLLLLDINNVYVSALQSSF